MNKILEFNLKNNRNHLNDNDECFLLKEYIDIFIYIKVIKKDIKYCFI